MDTKDNINFDSGPHVMVQELAHRIWASVVTVTKAYGKIEVNIYADNRYFGINIDLRWWARTKPFKVLRRYWMTKARESVAAQVPEGWKFIIYYKGEVIE